MADDPQMDAFTLEFTEDPARFLDVAATYLAARPVASTVVASVCHRALARDRAGLPRPDHAQWWVMVRSGADVVGVAMRTAPFEPFPAFVLPMPEAAARALARALHERGEGLLAANGALPATEHLTDETAVLTGGSAAVHEHTRLFELGELVPPVAVPGRFRPAERADLELVVEWFSDFHAAAAEQAGRPHEFLGSHVTAEDVAERIEAGCVFLWEDESGAVVNLTGASLPSFGVCRVGPVYTPREQRGRGYASACVAEVSRRLRDQGARVCLFTDQANPTSNRIYQALGFEPVVDMANIVVSAGPVAAADPAVVALL